MKCAPMEDLALCSEELAAVTQRAQLFLRGRPQKRNAHDPRRALALCAPYGVLRARQLMADVRADDQHGDARVGEIDVLDHLGLTIDEQGAVLFPERADELVHDTAWHVGVAVLRLAAKGSLALRFETGADTGFHGGGERHFERRAARKP